MGELTPARSYFPGLGTAVADRTINRKIKDQYGQTTVESWADVAERVALGNAMLQLPFGGSEAFYNELIPLQHHLRQASLLMSGRHLQHGDETQPTRNLEVFSNCSTSATTFLLFYLLLNGSGVGRAYDDELILADFNNMPIVVPVIDWSHADVVSGEIKGFLTPKDARHLYQGRDIIHFEVPDSREGWAKAIEVIEVMAFRKMRDAVLILDFTRVRQRNAPIKGMQNRPASGPGPLMSAVAAIAKLRDAGMAPWRAAMYADHYSAECVLVGGARRAARMSTKSWRDETIFDFIELKRGGFLWSSNNSVTIDQDFRDGVRRVRETLKVRLAGRKFTKTAINRLIKEGCFSKLDWHAYEVLIAIAEAAYYDGTGEPGLINQDKLHRNDEGMSAHDGYEIPGNEKLRLSEGGADLMTALWRLNPAVRYNMITNPCGEIALLLFGGYCVIADVVPFHAQNDDDAESAFRTAVRALIRVNTMTSIYKSEVKRTNRIGVGITGLHEWIYSRFKFTWQDIIDEEKSKPMWLMLSRFKRAVVEEAAIFAKSIGVAVPHTNTTMKPAGTTSKLFGLTEGAHLPTMREFLRWVQFRNDDPLVAEYEAKGYPVRRLKTYEGTTIVGFPTRPVICDLDGGEWVTTAAEATPEEQYQFLRLLEKYWLRGVEEDGVTPLADDTGNQVSYTLKYSPDLVDFEKFLDTLIDGQFSIKCCSVMPQGDASAYEYQPEEAVTKADYEMIRAAIKETAIEDVGMEHVDCGAGGCPVDFSEKVSA